MPRIDPISRAILAEIPKGKRNARPVSEIAANVPIHDTDDTKFSVRKRIKELIVHHEHPIGSCSDGYFIVETQHELEECIHGLEGRIGQIQRRIDALKEAYRQTPDSEKRKPHQPSIFD